VRCRACAAATLASLAGDETVASYIMAAPGDSVVKAVLALLEVRGLGSPVARKGAACRCRTAVHCNCCVRCTKQVEDEAGFSSGGHVRAAASTCLAFLACHPLHATGDDVLTGPFREQLLRLGALGALLRAALASSADDPCNSIIQQTAAVGIMMLTTMVRGTGRGMRWPGVGRSLARQCDRAARVTAPNMPFIHGLQAGAVDPAELAMFTALMTNNTNIQMVVRGCGRVERPCRFHVRPGCEVQHLHAHS
jgi:hypothetical protein